MNDEEISKKAYYDARKKNIKEKIDCSEVLEHYGVDLLYDDMEVQYACPLHGDGQDDKRSARYYPESDDTYCWGCQKYRDHIGLVMGFEGCSFTQALKILENKWNLSDIPSIYEFTQPGEDEKKEFQSSLENELDEIFEDRESLLDRFDILERKIDRFVSENRNSLEMESVLRIYHVCDHLMYRLENEKIEMEEAVKIARKLTAKIEEMGRNV
jgi:uncharacterized protein (DUF2267 family)